MDEQSIRRCFVISPIGDVDSPVRKQADMVLHYIIKPALEGYAVKRADELASPDMINDKVMEAIFNSEMAVADLTGHNPNVFYELGLRHMAEKPVIHIAQIGTKLPFDNAGVTTIFFDPIDHSSHVKAIESIKASLKEVNSLGYKLSNPVTQARASNKFSKSTDSVEATVGMLIERMAAAEQQIDASNKIVMQLTRMTMQPQKLDNALEPDYSPSPFFHSNSNALASLSPSFTSRGGNVFSARLRRKDEEPKGS